MLSNKAVETFHAGARVVRRNERRSEGSTEEISSKETGVDSEMSEKTELKKKRGLGKNLQSKKTAAQQRQTRKKMKECSKRDLRYR